MNVVLVLHKYEISLNDPCCYPLGFMYVSSWFKQQGYTVKILNYNLFDYDLVEEIKGQDLVGFTGFEEFKSLIIRDARICKELGIRTILGGALATFCGSEMKQYIDEVVTGECEFQERSNFDRLSWPDYEGLGISEYHKRHGWKYMGVMTGRGCPYSCTFCAQTCEFRLRKLNNVFAEIDFYSNRYGHEMTVFYDNTLNVNKKRFLQICEGMKSRGAWTASIRCDKVDEEAVKAAKESGCKYLVIGIESFNQEKLDRLNKRIKVEQIYRTLDLLHKYKINYHGNVLVGFEDESYEDIVREISLIPKGSNVFPGLVQPFIGTRNGGKRSISEVEYSFLSNEFKSYATNAGMTCLPEVRV